MLTKWEDKMCDLTSQSISLNVLTYNVRGWRTRSLEVVDLIFEVSNPVCLFTEVGEQWDNFNMFHQKGTNHSGGVMIAVGKHLKARRLEVDVENTIVVDVIGLSEQIRLIGIYWPQDQKRKLDDLRPHLVKGTIVTGDFNATAEAWCCKVTG